MKIYVGRWDLLPEDWKGPNILDGKSEEEIKKETWRQFVSEIERTFDDADPIPGEYSPAQFKELFGGLDMEQIKETYFVRRFENGKSVLAE